MRLVLLFLLPLLLTGCLEVEARLVWRDDGGIELLIRAEGEGELLRQVAPELGRQGYAVELSGRALLARRELKAAGWDRLSGWLPGRFSYLDPSGVELSRTSYVLFEDYRLSGEFVPLEVAGLPPFLAAAPFRFVVEAPFSPLRSNAERVEGRALVWEGTLGERFDVDVVWRLWYPERAALLLLILLFIALWRRSRRPRAA